MLQKTLVFLALAVVLGIPLALKLLSPAQAAPSNARSVVIITPHVPQIRLEFGEAFARWHKDNYGEDVFVDWRSPGAGTSELVKILEAQFTAAAKAGKFDFTDPKNPTAPPGTISFDIMFGGGSFDHGRLKTGVRVKPPGAEKELPLPMSAPAGFTDDELAAWFGKDAAGAVDNRVGAGQLFDPQQFWIGTALSSFGIVYNREVLHRMGVPEPRTFQDLTDPRLSGLVILADPRQSGSITTAFDEVLNAALWNRAKDEGWLAELTAAFDTEAKTKTPWEKSLSPATMERVEVSFQEGWRILREMTANARSFAPAATRPPIDISAGEGAAGLAIDFYGRGQAQAVSGSNVKDARLGYVDPQGATYIDADPASILRAGPNPDLAKRFVEFCLSPEGQLLWQLPSTRDPRSKDNPTLANADPAAKGDPARILAPRMYELRRMPVRKDLIAQHRTKFVDDIDPFTVAAEHRPANWRSAIGLMMGAFSIDNAHQQREAWNALNAARSNAAFPKDRLAELESLFYGWPETPDKDGNPLPFTAANYRTIRDRWRDPTTLTRLEVAYYTFFRNNYDRINSLSPN
ncbi:MAG TPA: extracellular solute-binding protein [Phycisphaerales bacterium]|nr:extracellular solute-binding protein [Phycisphaerales bacterium]